MSDKRTITEIKVRFVLNPGRQIFIAFISMRTVGLQQSFNNRGNA